MNVVDFSPRRPDPEMLQVVTCMCCGHSEYYGMMHMRNGVSMCRRCIRKVWQLQPGCTWEPGPKDYVFPKYEDGGNYVSGGDAHDS